MATTLHEQVALIDRTRSIDPMELTKVAAAIQTQVVRDLARYWPVGATVTTLDANAQIPHGVWPVFIVPVISDAGGFHLDQNGVPYAEVSAGADWTVAASHEICEMLVDPSGSRLKASRDLQVQDGQLVTWGPLTLTYLVEVCDPCEGAGYDINGVTVSDFYTPHFFDPHAVAGTRYSFTGALKGPRTLAQGGYLSWMNPHTQTWQQAVWLDPSQPPQIVDLGAINASGRTLREAVDEASSRALSARLAPAGSAQSAPKRPAASPNGTTVNAPGAAIVSAAGERWTLVASASLGNQIAVNGKTDGTTSQVLELRYVDGTVWQRNNNDLWWGKTVSTGAWLPTGGSSSPPVPAKSPAPSNLSAAQVAAIKTDLANAQQQLSVALKALGG